MLFVQFYFVLVNFRNKTKFILQNEMKFLPYQSFLPVVLTELILARTIWEDQAL